MLAVRVPGTTEALRSPVSGLRSPVIGRRPDATLAAPGSSRSVELLPLLCGGGSEERDVVAGGDIAGTELQVTTDQIRPAPESADTRSLAVLLADLDDVAVRFIDSRIVHLSCD